MIFSFRKLVKDHSKLQVAAPEEPILTSEDDYFKGLLSKYKVYDGDEGDDVNDSESEEEVGIKAYFRNMQPCELT